ncbi:hypothetical protein Q013_00489 [Pseudomonas aeruginosa X13273]|nr:hypothetical protein Q013_00489 [Pseudomonas aeruginosa X13273]
MKISVFGSGYVGLVQAAVLAEVGHDVLYMDIDRNKCGGVVLLARGSGWRRMAGSQTWRGFRGV